VNYGGYLQAIALVAHLRKQGHDAVIIKKRPAHTRTRRFVNLLLTLLPGQNFKSIRFNAKLQSHILSELKGTILPLSTTCRTTDEVAEAISTGSFESVIVGSDQVWRMDYIDDGSYEAFFLAGVDGKKVCKIAYSASFGRDKFQRVELAKHISSLLSDFSAISTREASGAVVCQDLFDINECRHTVDPTLLLSQQDYFDLGLFKERNITSGYTVVKYILDKDIATQKLLESSIALIDENSTLIDAAHNGRHSSPSSIRDWLSAIVAGDLIITDSFHGVVFSLIMKRNFVAIINHERGGDRFRSLLGFLDLNHKIVDTSISRASLKDALKPVDYKTVAQKIDVQIEQSKFFLNDALLLRPSK
jgi:hypothetical protein